MSENISFYDADKPIAMLRKGIIYEIIYYGNTPHDRKPIGYVKSDVIYAYHGNDAISLGKISQRGIMSHNGVLIFSGKVNQTGVFELYEAIKNQGIAFLKGETICNK